VKARFSQLRRIKTKDTQSVNDQGHRAEFDGPLQRDSAVGSANQDRGLPASLFAG
jgi:hypothetical protein